MLKPTFAKISLEGTLAKSLYYNITINQGSPTFLKLRTTSCVPINAKGNYSLIHTAEIKILLNLPSIILVLTFLNVKTLIILISFSEQAHVGDPALDGLLVPMAFALTDCKTVSSLQGLWRHKSKLLPVWTSFNTIHFIT